MQDIILKKKLEEGEEKVEVNKDHDDFEPIAQKTNNSNKLEWNAEEYTYREKTNDWYWTIGAVTVGLLVLSYFLDNFLFAVISVIGGFSIALLGSKKPSTLNFKITEKGIQIEDKIYIYENIDSFCINDDIEYEPRLFAKMKAGFLSVIILPVHEEDAEIIKDFLKKHLKEEEVQESFTSILMRLIGV